MWILLTLRVENGILRKTNAKLCRRNSHMSKMSPLDLARKLRLPRALSAGAGVTITFCALAVLLALLCAGTDAVDSIVD